IAGAKSRLLVDRGALFRRATRPCGRKTREHRIAPRLLALLVASAVALPVEVGPRVALLGLDVAAKLDAFARQLHQKARRRIHVGVTEERSPSCVREIRAVLRARDPDVAEARLLRELGFL